MTLLKNSVVIALVLMPTISFAMGFSIERYDTGDNISTTATCADSSNKIFVYTNTGTHLGRDPYNDMYACTDTDIFYGSWWSFDTYYDWSADYPFTVMLVEATSTNTGAMQNGNFSTSVLMAVSVYCVGYGMDIEESVNGVDCPNYVAPETGTSTLGTSTPMTGQAQNLYFAIGGVILFYYFFRSLYGTMFNLGKE